MFVISRSPGKRSPGKRSPGKSRSSNDGGPSATLLEGVAPLEEGEGGAEKYEKVNLDPLVFDREEFNSG